MKRRNPFEDEESVRFTLALIQVLVFMLALMLLAAVSAP